MVKINDFVDSILMRGKSDLIQAFFDIHQMVHGSHITFENRMQYDDFEGTE